MRQKTFILTFIVSIFLIACNNEQDKKIQINPLDQLELVDNLLSEISEKPQQLSAPSDKPTTVTGAKGTIIHLDPSRLETVDGSPLGDNIQIELLEMTDNSNLLLNNAQTISNGEILVTGGAYYLNMTSNGKQLKMKDGMGLEVEFAKLSENEMELFLGERDSLGQMNWIRAEQQFESKNLEEPVKPEPKSTISKMYGDSDLDDLFYYMDNIEPDTLTQEEIEAYEKLVAEYKTASNTYKAMELLSFGWINCDRFWNDPSPKTDIQLLVNKDSISGARIYAVFNDLNSVMTEYYWWGMSDTASFDNIPIGKNLTIIALSAKNETPLFFETSINTSTDMLVNIEFNQTNQSYILERINQLN